MERAELSTFSSRLRSSSPELVTLATKLKRIYHCPSREERRPIITTCEEAHKLMGHIGMETVNHLEQSVQGIRIQEHGHKYDRAVTLKDC
ncbi:uncharacterized protein BDR25DRAFT_104805 [Lindgomyces ingoldianus]|uniref:Uncharacterized protein n=1 Tax=Lindgomyces ingoldianus TaxID=673940 RepID=A0ACB6QAK1_9PLEO|nr:uncharacterized protein BDR25DRAFT_104805 [Lindgomyces ingoldianus]KAF2463937.1 hypothetical protein BDR25DRAFT_104805 [Lindgomyces ingoldianus]